MRSGEEEAPTRPPLPRRLLHGRSSERSHPPTPPSPPLFFPRISIYQGDVELKNLQLKPDALAELDLPICVKAGLLGSLTLKARVRCVQVAAGDTSTAPRWLLLLRART